MPSRSTSGSWPPRPSIGSGSSPRRASSTSSSTTGRTSCHVPPEWLDRLLGVLLDNACKYAPAGSTVVVAVKTDAGRVRLTVDDAGPGIPEDERARIFDRFHRATDATGGAGLGLAIADAIVRAIGRPLAGGQLTGRRRQPVDLVAIAARPRRGRPRPQRAKDAQPSQGQVDRAPSAAAEATRSVAIHSGRTRIEGADVCRHPR